MSLSTLSPFRELVTEAGQPCSAAHQELGEVFRELTESPEQAQFDEFAIHRYSLDGFPLRRKPGPFFTCSRFRAHNPSSQQSLCLAAHKTEAANA